MGNKHHMIDIESLDTTSTAIVLSIGVVEFDVGDWTITRAFHRVLETDTQLRLGRSQSLATKQWWAQQSDEARAIFDAPKFDTHYSLHELAGFLQGTQGVWGNGADFDNVIVGSLYDSYNIRRPWSFGLNRCHRTMKNFVLPKTYVKPERIGVHHDALADAQYQFTELRNICAALNLYL